MGLWVRVRGLAVASLVLGGVVLGLSVASFVTAGSAVAQTASSIVVEGNRRVESDTIRSYFRVSPGERLDPLKADEGVKALFATGLFADVRYRWEGGRLVVTVVENSVISRIQFEGNKRVKDEQLIAEIQSKPRGSLSRPLVQADVQRIVEIYRRNGRYDVRVEPKIIDRPNNRVDLVFEITEGGKTTVKELEFVGNRAYSAWRLRDVIKTGQSNLLSFLKNNDLYDPDRIEADRELLRRWYLKNGYADVRIVSAVAEFDPRRNGFILTFTIEEGDRYTFGSVDILSSVRDVDIPALRSKLRFSPGGVYNAELIEKSTEEMTIEVSKRGYAFANVRPRGDRNFETRQINIVFAIEEGARAYIERINVRGNTRTRDYVIRREFDIAEGDAYNRVLIDRAERRLKNLNYFKSVKVTNEPGSASDRVDHQRGRGGTVDRRILGRGRLLDGGRLCGRGLGWRTQPARPRPDRACRRHLRPAHPRRRSLVRRAVFPRLPAGVRHRPFRQADRRVLILRLPAGNDRRRLPLRYPAA